VAQIRATFAEVYNRNQSLLKDTPSYSHLKIAARVLATYTTLLPRMHNDQVGTIKMIQRQSGGATSSLIRWIVRISLHLCRDPFLLMERALRALQYDYGSTFTFKHEASEREVSTQVTTCFFNDFFTREGAPELTQCCCCSLDQMWFESVNQTNHAVEFKRIASLADGDEVCELMLRRRSSKPERQTDTSVGE